MTTPRISRFQTGSALLILGFGSEPFPDGKTGAPRQSDVVYSAWKTNCAEDEKLENNQPTFLDLLLETHVGLERQGPGSPAATKQALAFLAPLDRFERIADLGCGSGGQTLLLAEALSGSIVGLDLFPNFVEQLQRNAKAKGLEGRVTGVVGNMEQLPFEKGSLDLIWSEGAIDNIGFEKGLRHWHDFLKKDGYVAVTCPSWITKERPAEAEQFWADAGSKLYPVESCIEAMQDCGYTFVAAFVLPETCWTDHYYAPREAAIQRLQKKYPHSDTMQQYAAINRHEVELYQRYKQHYGYVFYLGRAR